VVSAGSFADPGNGLRNGRLSIDDAEHAWVAANDNAKCFIGLNDAARRISENSL
jgi:hypothetical protein